MPEDEKLYVHIKCSVCRGLMRGCPYCDPSGYHYVEASHKRVREWLKALPKEDRLEITVALEDA